MKHGPEFRTRSRSAMAAPLCLRIDRLQPAELIPELQC
eukprot:CAMPEP_0206163958 /NCGR_PEP_ID=MMETSP1474-20131121/12834_1 /ASSEMBLY_ACC=CAM_ASM_001110 /TAXON_ID=97495 /ORGANISM="Imantonia sp., Strain RCC918" /LENGTH=37 /DNA_ID= /DNA_START= /DNA_END= /DNA_ORIENTATION=